MVSTIETSKYSHLSIFFLLNTVKIMANNSKCDLFFYSSISPFSKAVYYHEPVESRESLLLTDEIQSREDIAVLGFLADYLSNLSDHHN